VKASPTRIGFVLFAAALAVRVVWVLLRWQQSGSALEFPDEELHWQLARNLVTHGQMVSDDGRYAARMPLYPLFLALFAWLGPTGILAARLAQCAIAAAAAWVAHRLATDALGPRAGILAGVLVAIDPYSIFFSNLLLTEVPFILLGLLFADAAWRVSTQPDAHRRADQLAVAFWGTGLVMTRPAALGWVGLVWIALWLWDAQRRRASQCVALYATVLAAALLPWGLRNRAVIGGFAWLSANGGLTLYDALGPQADGSSDQSFLDDMPELKGLGELERDRKLFRLALQEARRDPMRVLRLAWVKFRRTWSLTPNVPQYRRGKAALLSAAYTATVIVLALVGLLRILNRCADPDMLGRRRLLLLVWLPVVYFTLVHCVFIGSLRYRLPLMPLLAIAGSATLTDRATR